MLLWWKGRGGRREGRMEGFEWPPMQNFGCANTRRWTLDTNVYRCIMFKFEELVYTAMGQCNSITGWI